MSCAPAVQADLFEHFPRHEVPAVYYPQTPLQRAAALVLLKTHQSNPIDRRELDNQIDARNSPEVVSEMRRHGLPIKTELRPGPHGAPRAWYWLTDAGREMLAHLLPTVG